MDKIKEYTQKNKKTVILIIAVLALLIAAGIYFAVTSNDREPQKDVPESDKNIAGDTKPEAEEEVSEDDGDETENADVTDQQPADNKTDTQKNSGGNKDKTSNSNIDVEFIFPQSSCQHNWVTKTETVKEPYTVIVTEEKKPYTLYRFYWYNTGKWEETKDHKRFDAWMRDDVGGYWAPNSISVAHEKSPLFKGYDKNGNATYTNDHALIGPLYEYVPCEPYEKTEILEVTKTTTTCTKCGAVK